MISFWQIYISFFEHPSSRQDGFITTWRGSALQQNQLQIHCSLENCIISFFFPTSNKLFSLRLLNYSNFPRKKAKYFSVTKGINWNNATSAKNFRFNFYSFCPQLIIYLPQRSNISQMCYTELGQKVPKLNQFTLGNLTKLAKWNI